MNKKIFSALLDKVKSAKGLVGKIISGKSLKSEYLLTTERLASLVPNLGINDRLSLAKSLDLEILFREKRYDLLARLGQVEEFVNHGLSSEFIAHYPPYRKELGKKVYSKTISLITEQMLDEYLKTKHENFDFFFYHPYGLKAMVKNDFSGYIAAHEKEFRKAAERFTTEEAKKDYLEMLNRVLD